MINRNQIRAATQKIFEHKMKSLDLEFKATFNSEIFYWPRITARRNGQVVGSPRDIVDTGKLRDSQRVTISPMLAKFTWGGKSAPYAPWVLLGTKTTVPRDWIQATFDRGF